MIRPRGGRPDVLPTTAYTVLGLLTFSGEVTGYDLRRWAMNMRFFYWSPAQSQIYAELRRLRERGLVDERLEEQPGRPAKRFYTITEAGLDRFRAWLNEEPVTPPALKHSVALRLFFGHEARPESLRRILDGYLDWLYQQGSELHALGEQLKDPLPYPAMVADWGATYYAAEIAATQAALRALDKQDATQESSADRSDPGA